MQEDSPCNEHSDNVIAVPTVQSGRQSCNRAIKARTKAAAIAKRIHLHIENALLLVGDATPFAAFSYGITADDMDFTTTMECSTPNSSAACGRTSSWRQHQ